MRCRRAISAVPSGAAFLIPDMVLAMALAGCAGRSTGGRGTDPGQAAGSSASPAPGLSTRAAQPAPAGRLPVAIPAAARGQAFGYGTGLSY